MWVHLATPCPREDRGSEKAGGCSTRWQERLRTGLSTMIGVFAESEAL